MEYTGCIDYRFMVLHGLSFSQVHVFAWMKKAHRWANIIKIQGKIYYNISAKKACDDLPFVSGKPKTMKAIFVALEAKGLVKRTTFNNRTYVAFTAKSNGWFNSCSELKTQGSKKMTPGEKNGQGLIELPTKGLKKSPPGGQKNDPNHNTKDHSTKNPCDHAREEKTQEEKSFHNQEKPFRFGVKTGSKDLLTFENLNDLFQKKECSQHLRFRIGRFKEEIGELNVTRWLQDFEKLHEYRDDPWQSFNDLGTHIGRFLYKKQQIAADKPQKQVNTLQDRQAKAEMLFNHIKDFDL